MKINLFTSTLIQSKKNTKISFGTSARDYTNSKGEYIGTNTWLFRDDVDWAKLANYEKQHFKNKNKVNIVQFAASDGSEAYTKIISLLENNPAKDDSKFFPIQAYDIDPEITNAANKGLLNTNLMDRMNLQINCKDYNYQKYLKETKNVLHIKNDIEVKSNKTLKATAELTQRVNFHIADMYDILKNLVDKSNTILLCRNILGYFENNVVENFVKLVSEKLKPESLFIIGDHDTKNSSIEKFLFQDKFQQVMKNVYKKL